MVSKYGRTGDSYGCRILGYISKEYGLFLVSKINMGRDVGFAPASERYQDGFSWACCPGTLAAFTSDSCGCVAVASEALWFPTGEDDAGEGVCSEEARLEV